MARVFLNHAHVFPADLVPSGSLERLAQVAEQCGIDRVVCFAPLPTSPDPAVVKENPWLAKKAVMDCSGWLAEALDAWPQFVGFGTVDFRRADLREQVERIADLGLRGIKLHAPAQEFDVLGKQAFQVYEEAQRQALPVTFHTGPHGFRLKWYSDPLAYDEISFNFPELRIILEHVGHWPFFRQMAGVICNCNRRAGRGEKRAYAGLTAVFDQLKIADLAPEDTEKVLEWVGEDGAILGMDFPWYSAQQYRHDIDTVRRLNISDEGKSAILGGNLAALLGLT
jgi:predicted TIM-barrel fold metal-dependent hydrolase